MIRTLARVVPTSFVCLLGSLAPIGCGDSGGAGTTTGTTTGTTGTGTSTGAGDTSATPASTSDAPTTEPTTAGTTGDAGSSQGGDSTETVGSTEVDPSDTGSTQAGSTETGATETGGSETGGGFHGELRVLQLNLCHSGVAGCFTGNEVMTKAVAVIKDVAPGLVTLNEVCRKDLPFLAAQTGAVDHHFTPALKSDDSPVKCKNGEDYGIGLLSWVAPAWAEPVHGVYSKQSSMTERRVWICMGYEGFVGCTTHLSTSGATAIAQCHDLVDGPLATAAAQGPAVMAGDWNLKFKGSPDAQDCVPVGFFRKGDGAVQHLIASDHFGFVEAIKIDMQGTTDHPGLEVRLTLP